MFAFKSFITLSFLSLLSFTIEARQTYLCHSCSNTTTFPTNGTYQADLNHLLSSLSSNATRGNRFYNTTSGRNSDVIYGLFLCRGDVSESSCEECVSNATNEVTRRCPVEKIAVIWYDNCLLRYSNQSIFSIVTEEPALYLLNTGNVTDQDNFSQILYDTLDDAATHALNATFGLKNFATREVNISRFQRLYSLVQCTPDLSSADCNTCLRRLIEALPYYRSRKQGGKLLASSCNIRFELYPFYNHTAPPAAPDSVRKQYNTILRIQLLCVFATLVSLIFTFTVFLLSLWIDFQAKNDGGVRYQELPLIQLDILKAATKQFCDENKLGEGGFGPVYKGKLADGKEIAIKRLSITSEQGLREFKSEVKLIAKLQHRNLVRLEGCCLEEKEKLLVYEYMPNKSLDVFLFDSSISVQLDWQKRLNIINGIARGIMYLHEDSRLKIIHRDIKASNVLLDDEMNPKISDFGIAKIFCGHQGEANTSRVVGTLGYMAPEYAMEGVFSIKSDVFSFGVLLLEIISGKRNNGFHNQEHGESLLTFTWKLWCKGQGMKLVDPLLVQSCAAIEVLKCIHIGLLCVQDDPAERPEMSLVVAMLASEARTLPLPAESALSIGRVVVKPTQSTSNDGVCSTNEVTISNMSPR